MSKLLQPFIQQTERGKNTQCQICRKKFHIFNRAEHKCKRCYRSVCVTCAPTRTKTYKQDGTVKDHRVCKKCQGENRLILKYFEDYKLKFGEDSDFSIVWIKRLNKEKKLYSVIMSEYLDNLAETNQSIQKFKRQSSILFENLYKSYNYSVRYFIELIKSNKSNKQFEDSVSNVMVGVLNKIPNLYYFSEMIYIVVFFLSFSSQCHTYFILSSLFQKIYPQYQIIFRPKRDNIMTKEVKIIVNMIEQLIDPNEKDIMSEIKRYLDSEMCNILNTLTINFCNFQVTLHLIHETLQKVNYYELYKGVASLIYLAKGIIIKRIPYSEIERYILKNITLENVKAQMCRLEKFQAESNNPSNSNSNGGSSNLSGNRTSQRYSTTNNSNITSQKVQTLQKMIVLVETQLKKKDEQLAQYKQKQIEYEKDLLNERKLTESLKEKLCLLSCRLQQIHKYEQVKNKNIELSNSLKQQEIKNIKMINQINLLKAKEEEYMRQLEEFKLVYEIEDNLLTKLQTENEVMKLKMEVKDINFQTDHFEGQILDKNRKILDYEERLSEADIKIKYLEKTVKELQEELIEKSEEKCFNMGYDLQVQETACENGEVINEYKEQIELFTTTLKRQKERLDQFQRVTAQNEQKIKKLQSENSKIEKQKEVLGEKLDEMIKLEIGPKQNDQGLIQLIDREIDKEDNLIRKHDIQKIKIKVKYYQHEIKIKDLDLRLKGNKIEEYMNSRNVNQVDIVPQLLDAFQEETANNFPKLKQKEKELKAEGKQKQDCLLF